MIKKWILTAKSSFVRAAFIGEAKDIPPSSINPIPVFGYFFNTGFCKT